MSLNKLTIVLALLVSTFLARAGNITINDPSFEGITGLIACPVNVLSIPIIGTNSGTIGAWNVSAGSSVAALGGSLAINTDASLGAPSGEDGANVVRISLPLGLGATMDLNQTLNTSFSADSLYNLSFELDASSSLLLLADCTISLKAGNTVFASYSGTALEALLTAPNQFQTVNLTFQTGDTAPTGNIGIDINAASPLSLGGNVYLDNFQMNVSPVPEPGTTTLAGVSIGLFFGLRAFRSWKMKKSVPSAGR